MRSGRFHLVTSAVVQEEITPAPAQIREFFEGLLETAETVVISNHALELRDAYVSAGIVAPHWRADALHVALASVANCSLLVSWNFKHIVHFEKIPLYNAVNILHGYSIVAIYSPREVISYEEDF